MSNGMMRLSALGNGSSVSKLGVAEHYITLLLLTLHTFLSFAYCNPMPSATLPPEVLTVIFNDLGISDLVSCSIVCYDWHFTAFALLEKKPKMRQLRTQRLSIDELKQLADAFTFSQQHRLALGAMVTHIEIPFPQCTDFSQTLIGPAKFRPFAEHLVRLVNGLDNSLHTLMLDFNSKTISGKAISGYLEILEKFLTETRPGCQGITNLSISGLPGSISSSREQENLANNDSAATAFFIRMLSKPAKSRPSDQIPPLIHHPVVSLIWNTHSRLQHLTLFNCHFNSTESISLSLALRRCPNIHTLRLHNINIALSADHLADTVASWPGLVHFSIRATSQSFKQPRSFLGPVLRRLTLAKPRRHLTILDVQAHVTSTVDRELRGLVTASAPTLQQLYLPSVNYHEGDALLSHVCALNMPVLRILNIVHTHCSRRNLPDIESFPPLRWPELRVVAMATCRGTMWDVGRRLVNFHPHVNCMLVKNCTKAPGYERLTGLLENNGFRKLESRAGLEPWVTERYEEGEWEEKEQESLENNDGLLIRL